MIELLWVVLFSLGVKDVDLETPIHVPDPITVNDILPSRPGLSYAKFSWLVLAINCLHRLSLVALEFLWESIVDGKETVQHTKRLRFLMRENSLCTNLPCAFGTVPDFLDEHTIHQFGYVPRARLVLPRAPEFASQVLRLLG